MKTEVHKANKATYVKGIQIGTTEPGCNIKVSRETSAIENISMIIAGTLFIGLVLIQVVTFVINNI